MIRIPSYELVAFLDWLSRRRITLSRDHLSESRLIELARQFLQGGGLSVRYGIQGLMTIFQLCPMIRESTVVEQMQHFARCGRCLDMMARPDIGRFGSNYANSYRGEVSQLHPLLQGFVEFARESSLDTKLRTHYESDGDDDLMQITEIRFRQLIRTVGEELLSTFMAYIEGLQDDRRSLVADYEHRRGRVSGNEIDRRGRLTEIDERAVPLGRNESKEDAAHRLAFAVRAAIESGEYDKAKQELPVLQNLMSLVLRSTKNFGQVIEFLNWLNGTEPKLNVIGSIPSVEIESLALTFCEERGYANGGSFSKEVRKWLSGNNAPASFIEHITALLGRWPRKAPIGSPFPQNPLDRYGSVRFHGLFLFLSSGDFPAFIDAHWRDLHYITGDDLDIYYSEKELKERTSGYEIAAKLPSLKLGVRALPSLFLWQDSLQDGVAIPLNNLGHSEIVEIVQIAVEAIKENRSLSEIRQFTTEHLNRRRVNSGGIHVESGSFLLINNGEVMGDHNENKGVATFVGGKQTISNSVFTQDARNALASNPISVGDVETLQDLSRVLATQDIKGIEHSKRFEGAMYLGKLAEAVKYDKPQDAPLAEWKEWLQGLGDGAKVVLATLAAAVTVATALAKLLGFSS